MSLATETDTAAGVLAAVRGSRHRVVIEEALQLELACEWAAMHPAESIEYAACYGDSPVPVAGPGAPLVAEFAIAEFAAALGMPTELGKAFLGEALELQHRLPRLWARVMHHELPGWRARRIAAATIGLTAEAARFVDRHIAPVAHKITPAGTDRLVDAAIAAFMPDQAAQQRDAGLDRRFFDVDHRQVSYAGTARVIGELDLADALDLDQAVTARAAHLADLGSEESLDARRAQAIAEIARHDLTLDLETGAPDPATTRQTVLTVHLTDDSATGYVANTKTLVTLDQVQDWCSSPFTTLTIKPVIDLDGHRFVAGYQIPDPLKEQVDLRDRSCVFPWCTRPARRCDHDHTIPHDQDGPTCTCNLAPLCRRHHRLKTHGSWVYTTIDPGTFLWTSPHGYQFLRDPVGTRDVTRDRPTRPPPDD